VRYKVFGRQTGLRVSELVLGAGSFGTRRSRRASSDWGPSASIFIGCICPTTSLLRRRDRLGGERRDCRPRELCDDLEETDTRL